MVKGINRRRPARGHGRRLQPHARGRAGPEVGPRPHRARLLPAARPGLGRGGDLDLLLEHRDGAPDDGQAARRLRAHVGDAVQGRRLPLRPDGPPAQGADGAAAARARRAHAQARRRGRRADLPVRRGLELRRGGRQRALRPGQPAQHGRHRDRDVLRPAARRRPRRRAVRRRPGRAGLRQRAVHRPERVARERHARRAARPAAALPGPDQARPGRQPARLRVRRQRRADGHAARRSTTTASPRATPPIRARRSPTSTRTTTRRCSTPCSSSCLAAPRWPTACA